MTDLFGDQPSALTATSGPQEPSADAPLAARLRPRTLADVVGQNHLLNAESGAIGRQLAVGRLGSLILWGPPGCGKTTIARLLAAEAGMTFESLSAVFSGVAEVRKVLDRARERRRVAEAAGSGERGCTLLFVDEIHRFNKAQQDGFLPVVEDGTVTLVGATTENPSFELNAALLSRAPVMVLHRLDEGAMGQLLARAEELEGRALNLTEEARAALIAMADGDGRYALGLAEAVLAGHPENGAPLDSEGLAQLVSHRAPVYDKVGEAHYNLISVVHKSLRASDTDAALYWTERMLAGGEDPGYLLRRLMRFAVEDVGLADPMALTQAIACWQAYERLGSPEGDLAITQLVIYLGTAPKSNAIYKAQKAAAAAAADGGSVMPPKHALNAPTKMMKQQGYGDGYIYDHDTPEGFSGLSYFPQDMERARYYHPVERGFERELAKRISYWDGLREKRAQQRDEDD